LLMGVSVREGHVVEDRKVRLRVRSDHLICQDINR
jgi:hypothetical protein